VRPPAATGQTPTHPRRYRRLLYPRLGLDRLAGAIERASGRVTERTPPTSKIALNCPTSATASATRSTPRGCRTRHPGSAVGQPREKADGDAAHAEPDHLRALTAVIHTSAQRAESALCPLYAGYRRQRTEQAFTLSNGRSIPGPIKRTNLGGCPPTRDLFGPDTDTDLGSVGSLRGSLTTRSLERS